MYQIYPINVDLFFGHSICIRFNPQTFSMCRFSPINCDFWDIQYVSDLVL